MPYIVLYTHRSEIITFFQEAAQEIPFVLWLAHEQAPNPLPDNTAAVIIDWAEAQPLSTAIYPSLALIHQADDRSAALQAGAADYILWPCGLEELSLRLRPYLTLPTTDFEFMPNLLYQLKNGVSADRILQDSLQQIRQTAGAELIRLYTWDEQQHHYTFHHLPEPNINEALFINALPAECTQQHVQTLIVNERPLYTLFLPITNHAEEPMGWLLLGYQQPLQRHPHEMQRFSFLIHSITSLITLAYMQEEAQTYATQTALIVLVAKMLSEITDLNSILALTIEHIMGLLNAAGGAIWLRTNDGKMLQQLSSATTANFELNPYTNRPVDAGLIGWVIQQNEFLLTAEPDKHPAFNSLLDNAPLHKRYTTAAVPLHHKQLVGVMIVYNPVSRPFTRRDITLLSGMSGLFAAAIVNARLMQELRDYGEQQHILYEMSQNIGGGLDLQGTLNRALNWATRLCTVEEGFLWLLDEDKAALELVAVHRQKQQHPLVIPLAERSLIGWVVDHCQPVMCDDVLQDERFNPALNDLLNFPLRSMLAVPLIYHGEAIGVLSLLNKVESDFTLDDLTLLSTAVEMIAIAIGNAYLHNHTLTLMAERQRLHEQALQSERLATVGRLTASLAHEINNPLQVIKGSLILAKEEIEDTVATADYLELSLGQVDRVTQLVSRMRQIYRPQQNEMSRFNLITMLHEVLAVTKKELQRQEVHLHTQITADICPVHGVADQIHLVFLNLTLNLVAHLSERQERADVSLRARRTAKEVIVELVTNTKYFPNTLRPLKGSNSSLAAAHFSLAFSQDIINTHGGTLNIEEGTQECTLRVILPLATTQTSKKLNEG